MTKHVAVSVPIVLGIDLSFRPRSYFGPIPAETHVLAHVTGHERREILRAQLSSDDDDPMLDLLVDLFEGRYRESLGRIHVRVSSEFYPEIGAYYDRRVAAWFAKNHPQRGQEEGV